MTAPAPAPAKYPGSGSETLATTIVVNAPLILLNDENITGTGTGYRIFYIMLQAVFVYGPGSDRIRIILPFVVPYHGSRIRNVLKCQVRIRTRMKVFKSATWIKKG